MNYNDWLCEWLVTCVKPMVKPRTFEHYNNIVRLQIAPELGNKQLSDLSVSVLQKFAAGLTQKYARSTVMGIINVVKSSLAGAYRFGLVSKSFSGGIKCPKTGEKQIECFTSAEQKKIERYVFESGNDKLFWIVFALYTGLRIGELLALKWGDFDMKHCVVYVNKTCRDSWREGEYEKIIDTPKTETSRRKIPMPKQLSPWIKAVKKRSKSRFAVSGKNGEVISIRSYQRSFELLLKQLKLPHRGFHALRHTFATRALECGMDIESLSKILGHKNPNMTLKHYAHSFMEHQNTMMNKLGKLLIVSSGP